MEKLAHRFAEQIAAQLHYDPEKQSVIAYGLTGLLQLIVLGAAFAALGILFSLFWELAVLYIAVALYRKYSGGAHASSMGACTVFSIVICLLFAFGANYLSRWYSNGFFFWIATAGIFLFAFLVVKWKAPVDSPNKPIRTKGKKIRMRKGCFVFLTASLFLGILLFLFFRNSDPAKSLGMSLLLAVGWQTFTLIKPGIFFIHWADRFILWCAHPFRSDLSADSR